MSNTIKLGGKELTISDETAFLLRCSDLHSRSELTLEYAMKTASLEAKAEALEAIMLLDRFRRENPELAKSFIGLEDIGLNGGVELPADMQRVYLEFHGKS